MQRGLPYLAGNPVRPYKQFSTEAGSDVWLELQFLDRDKVPAIPASVTYRIDNITDVLPVQGDTLTPTPTDTHMEINIPASVNIMQRQTRSSQLNQVKVVSTFGDGSTKTSIYCYELIAIGTPGGA